MMKPSITLEKYLPFFLALLMPGLSLATNQSMLEPLDFLDIISTWLISSCLLLVIWYANKWLMTYSIHPYFLYVVILNISLIIIFVAVVSVVAPVSEQPSTLNKWVFSGRLLLASAIFIIIQQGIKSAKALKSLESENISLKTEKYRAELDQLRKQVNPHFLFNSLSVLRTMVRSADPKSETFVVNLSSLYRQILQSHDKNYTTLEEEIKFLNAYIYLLKVRHEESLFVSININDGAKSHSIPIFALQLLVENGIKHNILSVDKPLTINVFQQNDVTITVENNYQPKQKNNGSTGLGLNNLRQTYALLGIENGITIDQTEHEFSVTLKLF